MTPVAGAAQPQRAAKQAELRKVAHLLDSAFRIPGTQRRFGLDALMGLVPGFGDVAGLAVSTGLVVQAVRLGARGATVVRMVLLVALDATVGTVPVVGSVFDFVFKANTRAMRLLERHADEPDRTRAESARAVRRTIIGVVLAAVAVVALVIVALVGVVAAVV